MSHSRSADILNKLIMTAKEVSQCSWGQVSSVEPKMLLEVIFTGDIGHISHTLEPIPSRHWTTQKFEIRGYTVPN